MAITTCPMCSWAARIPKNSDLDRYLETALIPFLQATLKAIVGDNQKLIPLENPGEIGTYREDEDEEEEFIIPVESEEGEKCSPDRWDLDSADNGAEDLIIPGPPRAMEPPEALYCLVKDTKVLPDDKGRSSILMLLCEGARSESPGASVHFVRLALKLGRSKELIGKTEVEVNDSTRVYKGDKLRILQFKKAKTRETTYETLQVEKFSRTRSLKFVSPVQRIREKIKASMNERYEGLRKQPVETSAELTPIPIVKVHPPKATNQNIEANQNNEGIQNNIAKQSNLTCSMKGDCDCCRNWHENLTQYLGVPSKKRTLSHREEQSRHKYLASNHPVTPLGYWDIEFPPSQMSKGRPA